MQPTKETVSKSKPAATPEAKKKNALLVMMGILSLLMVGGMAFQFAPGGPTELAQQFRATRGTPAVTVNGKPITAEYLAEVERSQPFPLAASPQLNDDYRIFILEQVIRQELLKQASADIQITRQQVADEVKKVREQQGLTDDKAWTNALAGAGMSDHEYRQQVKDRLAATQRTEQIQATVPAPTDEEMKMYYELNPTLFKSRDRIKARQIVTRTEAEALAAMEQLREGADFDAVAKEKSTRYDQSGSAVGALGEGGALQAVESVVLPAEVASEVDKLHAPGRIGPVASGGMFYIVSVEELLPAETRSFDSVKEEIQTALKASKNNAALEKFLDEEYAKATIVSVSDQWPYINPTVATIEGQNVPYSEVVSRVMQNGQLMAMAQGMPPEQVAELVNSMLKPSLLDGIIEEYAAAIVAEREKLPLVGNRPDLKGGVIAYGGRDTSVSEDELKAAYEERRSQFETLPSATIAEATFKSREAALAFQRDWKGGDFTKDASKAGALVNERGDVSPSDGLIDESLMQAIFSGDLRQAGDVMLSAAVEATDGWKVAAVSNLQRAEVLPFADARSILQQSLFQEKQAAAGEGYLAKQTESMKIERMLDKVLAEQAARVPAAPAETAPAASGDGASHHAPSH